MASYAVIVLNPSTDIALITELDVRLLDGDDVPVLNLDAGRDVVHSVVNLIMPGETQAISNLAYIEHDDVDSIEVGIGASKWALPQDGRFMPLTADGVVPEPDGDGAVVTFEVDSPYEGELTAVSTYAIFRDAAGELLGGSAPIDADPLSYTPGINDGEIDVSSGVPPEWDPALTEVYVDPFVD